MKPVITHSGILPCYKPSGIGSLDLIRQLKRRFSFKKIGHLGTLDPIAEGVLPVMINQGTKLADFLEHHGKQYRATIHFGLQTDTFDITGTVTDRASFDHISQDHLTEILPQFTGVIEQIPPKYAAVKINGVPAYKLARAGKEVTLKPRQITIHNIKLLNFNPPEAVIDIDCGKGTYIRSLINDIAEKLNTKATMSALIRTASGGFTIDHTVDPETLLTPDQLTEQIQPIDHLLTLPKFELNPFEYKLVCNGTIPDRLTFPAPGVYQLFFNNHLKSIIEFKEDRPKFLRQFHLDL